MRKGSRIILGVLAGSFMMTALAPFISPQSGNPCSGCHGANYHQYLDILEGDGGNVLPAVLNDGEILTVKAVLINDCNTGTYNVMTSISATLTSQNGLFGVQAATYNIGSLNPGQTAYATWQIYTIARGDDRLLLTASGRNTHYNCQFSDSYSPAPSIFVNKTVIDNPPAISINGPTAGLRLTGGTDRLVSWGVLDEDKGNCRVNLYFSTDDFATHNETIATDLPAAQTCLWTLPLIDSANVLVKATIIDAKGQFNQTVMSGPFTIDSTPPTILTVQPPDKEANVTDSAILVVGFSEPVAESGAQMAFSISPEPGGLVWQWNQDQTTMSAVHSPFGAATAYTCTVSTGVKDLSIPGNTLRQPYSWSFRTPAEMVPVPSINVLSPSGGERFYWGEKISVRWAASGGTGALGVNITVSANGPAGPFTLAANHLPNSGSFSLLAVAIESDTCILELTVYDQNGMVSTAQSGDFALARNILLNASFPQPAEPILAGNATDLAWSVSGGHGDVAVALYFQPDENASRQLVASGLPRAGTNRWTAPELNSAGARFFLNATDEWNGSAENASPAYTIRTKNPPPPPPPPRENHLPVVLFQVRDGRVVQNSPVTFDASRSFDPDNDPIYYIWDFSDGTSPVNTTNATVSHLFSNPGEFGVRLVVGDGRGQSEQTMPVLVKAQASASPAALSSDWPTITVGMVIVMIGLVGTAYAAMSRPSKRAKAAENDAGEPASARTLPSAEPQPDAAAAASIAVYGTPPPRTAAKADAPAPLLLDGTRCIGCGNCARACSAGVIVMLGERPGLVDEKCTVCGECVRNCPREAISLNK